MHEIPTSETNEKVTSKIVLHFFRHGKKVVGDIPDHSTPLSDEGRREAISKATLEDTSQSVAFGTTRQRTQETAGLMMGGKSSSVSETKNLDELKAVLDDELYRHSKGGHPSKIGVDNNLDRAYDDLPEDNEVFAGQIARIIEKYSRIAPRWDKLVNKADSKYSDTMERFLSTHYGVGEAFMLKIIETTKGIEARRKFLLSLAVDPGNEGFDFLEGFDVEIVTKQNKEIGIRVIFHKNKGGNRIFSFDEEISFTDLQKIIA